MSTMISQIIFNESKVPINANTSIDKLIAATGYYWWVNGVIAVFNMAGNMLIIVLILRRAALRTKQNWYILSLAVADFLVGIGFGVEMAGSSFYKNNHYTATVICFRITDFFTSTSITNLCALTLDRHLAITYPLKHRLLQRKSNIVKTLAVAWFVAFLIPLVDIILELVIGNPKILESFAIFVFLGFTSLSCVALPLAYSHLVLVVSRRHKAQLQREANQQQRNHDGTRRHQPRNTGIIRVLGGVIGFFVVSHVLSIYNGWLFYISNKKPNSHLLSIAMLLVNLNSANNVIVYSFFKKDFRHEIDKLLCRKIRLTWWIDVPSGGYTLPQLPTEQETSL